MAAADASAFPVKGQAYRLSGFIRDWTTGQVISNAGTLASTVSKDGGAFASTTSTAVEVGTTGMFTLDLSSTEMNANTVAVKVTASTANTEDFIAVLYPMDLAESGTRADTQTVKRLEQWISQIFMALFNKFTINRSTGAMVLYEDDESTSAFTGTASDDGTTNTRPHLS
jgi:hypothetical protein